MYDAAFLAHLHHWLSAALPRWGLPVGTPLVLLNVSENATFLAGGTLVLRVYRQGYHAPAEMRSELDWIAALRAAGVVRTPAPVPALDGTLLQAIPDGATLRHVVAGRGPVRPLPAARRHHRPAAPPCARLGTAGRLCPQALGLRDHAGRPPALGRLARRHRA
jgi:Ser/Thr protein kinase RdoA (MazF antagonist)